MAPASSKVIVVSKIGDAKSADDHPAVVALLGWFGAEEKHLQKYVDLYTTRGCSVVATGAKNVDVLLGSEKPLQEVARKVVRNVARLIREADSKFGSKTPVIFQGFSNGGGFVIRQLDLLLKKYGTAATISKDGHSPTTDDKDFLLVANRLRGSSGGIILDSAPAYMYPEKALLAIRLAVSNVVVRSLLSLLFRTYVGLSRVYAVITQTPTQAETYWEDMLNLTLSSNECIIYSTVDKLTDVTKLDEYVEARQKKVDSFHVLKFEDSPHVLHLRYHGAEYEKFIEKIIGKVSSKST